MQDSVLLGSHVQMVLLIFHRVSCMVLLNAHWCCRGLVAAGLKDLSRPADKISIPQNLGGFLYPSLTFSSADRDDSALLALTATGLIWVRYSFVIVPVNYSLAAVNCFVGGTGIMSLYRAYEYVYLFSGCPLSVGADVEGKNHRKLTAYDSPTAGAGNLLQSNWRSKPSERLRTVKRLLRRVSKKQSNLILGCSDNPD